MSLETPIPKRPTCSECALFDHFGVLAVAVIRGFCKCRKCDITACQAHVSDAMSGTVHCRDCHQDVAFEIIERLDG